VARLDRDVAGGDKSQAILERMRKGEVDILVGTQMVAKGHDLPAVTLVGVVNADASLSMPDFRASERGFQLLVQVAGRAGRREKTGKVLIQTRAPEHPAIQSSRRSTTCAASSRRSSAIGARWTTRPSRASPSCASTRATRRWPAAPRPSSPRRRAPRRRRSPGASTCSAPPQRPSRACAGAIRFRVLLRGKERGPLRAVIEAVSAARDALPRQVRVAIDVDPVSML
jgi:primosomal protein N' (replication factor Y)